MNQISVNFCYKQYNSQYGDHIADDRYYITAVNEEDDIIEKLRQTKKLCRDGHIVDAAGDDSMGYTIDVTGDNPNPLDNGDNAGHLLEIAKSIGYIKDYERFGFDFDLDFDAEL